MDLILLISCCLLLLLETVITEHARLIKYFEKVNVEEKQELQGEDIQVGWGFNQQSVTKLAAPPVLTKATDSMIYEQSNLTKAHEELFSSLMQAEEGTAPEASLDFVEAEYAFENEPLVEENFIWEELSTIPQAQTQEPESDYLTMDDWEEEPVATSVDTQLSATASHKISDGYIGEQLWVVEVVGYEQHYIHVSDGATRTWLNVSKFKNIHQGDILSVLVEREVSDHLTVLDVDMLQKKSNDFAIEIEEDDFQEHSLEYAI